MLSDHKGKQLQEYVKNYVVFDLETTGISWKTDEVIEISAVKVLEGKTVEEFDRLVNPGRSIPYGASRVNGITNSMVKDAPYFQPVLKEFFEFTGNLPLVGHNIAAFDMNFLYRDAEKYFGKIPDNDYIDTLYMARKYLPDMKHHKLTDLAQKYRIDTDGAHRALNDCHMNQKVFEYMAGGQKQNQDAVILIRGVVERITYQNPENGYTILKCAVKNYSELVTVVGNLLDVYVGSVLLIHGNWKVDSKYGRQFIAQSWEETMPATIYGIEKYLGSGLIKGVGPKYAKKIVQKFGTDTITVIETDIQRLNEIEGIGSKRIKQIAQSWEKQREIKNIMLFLQEYGVSTAFAAKIYRQYGNEGVSKVKENPFRLADDIWGIGFKTADMIAQKMGFEKESFVRLRSGILYTLSALSAEGHVYAKKDQLIERAADLLEAEDGPVVMTLDQMKKDKDVIFETIQSEEQTEAVYLPPFYYAEIGTAAKLRNLAKRKEEKTVTDAEILQIEEKLQMKFDEVQADAIKRAISSKVMILTGGPGTGKTTTVRGIIAAFAQMGSRIILAAPTGRAAKRMTETTGMEAKTIHRLLEGKPSEGFGKNQDNPLLGDVLIVDECSMIDILLMNALLKAVPENMRVILVGDIDQLPSVGPGNVLRDVIDSEAFPVIRLTRIFRQAKSSRIITNAHKINKGERPDISNGRDTDFFFVRKEEAEEAVREVVALVKTKLPRYYKVAPEQIQVLTPMQRGIAGTVNLNMLLQEALNPSGEGLRRGGMIYRTNDKVMQIRNNYDKDVYNGDIGMVSQVNMADRTLKVDFEGKQVMYEVTELDELVHAYATTIHKSQGSEYPIVVLPLLMNHYVMLQRNLLYTGITRAKKILVMVGEVKALDIAVKNRKVMNRNTLLSDRIARRITGKGEIEETMLEENGEV